MVRHLTTLILGGILGSMVLVGNAEACHKKKCWHVAPVVCAAPTVCVTPVCPPPAPCVQAGWRTCAPKVKCCKITLPKLCLPKFCQKKTCCSGSGRRGLRNARSIYGAPVGYPRLATGLGSALSRPPADFPPISHDRLHRAVAIVTVLHDGTTPAGARRTVAAPDRGVPRFIELRGAISRSSSL